MQRRFRLFFSFSTTLYDGRDIQRVIVRNIIVPCKAGTQQLVHYKFQEIIMSPSKEYSKWYMVITIGYFHDLFLACS